jgi:transposase-like protein
MRKSYSPSFKAEVAIALLREDTPLSRIASEVGVSPSLLSRWKAAAIEKT